MAICKDCIHNSVCKYEENRNECKQYLPSTSIEMYKLLVEDLQHDIRNLQDKNDSLENLLQVELDNKEK